MPGPLKPGDELDRLLLPSERFLVLQKGESNPFDSDRTIVSITVESADGGGGLWARLVLDNDQEALMNLASCYGVVEE